MLDMTVCILSYNRPSYLREALQSVLMQTKRPKNIVVYDNGSDNDVYSEVKDLLELGVQWVGAETNHSFMWNFNRAKGASKTKYTMLMHDDDRLSTIFLETQFECLNSHPEFVAISCNGYFINDAGMRTGSTLASVNKSTLLETYTSSGQVAIKYASNSCIPFSPTIYKSEILHTVNFREEFEKVCDAVYYCDLAEIGTIAYQTAPLYEVRIHSGQDSSHFPYELMNQLEVFFLTTACNNVDEKRKLKKLLLKQHASRNLRRLVKACKDANISLIVSVIKDERFHFSYALSAVFSWCVKNVWKQ